MEQIKPNGAYIIIEDGDGKVLIERGSYGHWMLPGGTAERIELLIHAGMDETLEETGLIVEQADLTLIAQFVQKVVHNKRKLPMSGVVNIYATTQYDGELHSQSIGEVEEWRWVTVDEMYELYRSLTDTPSCRAHSGTRPYMKTIALYEHIKRGLIKPVYEGVWGDKMPFRPVAFI